MGLVSLFIVWSSFLRRLSHYCSLDSNKKIQVFNWQSYPQKLWKIIFRQMKNVSWFWKIWKQWCMGLEFMTEDLSTQSDFFTKVWHEKSKRSKFGPRIFKILLDGFWRSLMFLKVLFSRSSWYFWRQSEQRWSLISVYSDRRLYFEQMKTQ